MNTREFEHYRKTTKTTHTQITSKKDFMKNISFGITKESSNLKNSTLLVNISPSIDIVEVLEENKILTIEVLNKKLFDLLNKKISMDFFSKLVIKANKNVFPNKKNVNSIEIELNAISIIWNRDFFKIHENNKFFTFEELLNNLKKAFKEQPEYRIPEELKKEIYNLLTEYVADYLEDFIQSYKIKDNMNVNSD